MAFEEARSKFASAAESFKKQLASASGRSREEITGQWQDARFQAILCDYYIAQTYADPKDPKRKEILEKASREFDAVYQRSRMTVAGLYPHMWQGKCVMELGDNDELAMDIFDEVIVALGDPGDKSKVPAEIEGLLAQVEQFRLDLIAKKSPKQAVAEANEFRLKYRRMKQTEGYQSIVIALAKAILAESENLTEFQKIPIVSNVTKILAGMIRTPDDYQQETQGQPEGSRNTVGPTIFEDAVVQATAAAGNGEWDAAITHYRQAMDFNDKSFRKKEPKIIAEIKDALGQSYFMVACQQFTKGKLIESLDTVKTIIREHRDASVAPAASVLGATILLNQYLAVSANSGDDKAAALARVIRLAQFTINTWPGRPEADDARMTRGQAYVVANQIDEAMAEFDSINFKRTSLQTGGSDGFDVKACGQGIDVMGKRGVGAATNAGEGFGGRGSGHRKAMLASGGGTRQSERAVAAALHWLWRHQLSDGSWSLSQYKQRCSDGSCTGTGSSKADTGATGLGLLPYLAAGQTHKTKGPYRETIQRGLLWLLRHQERDGNLAKGCDQPMYSHGLATIALCEAYGLTHDNAVGHAAQGAVNYILAAQNKNDFGWRYTPGQAGDTSVVGWQVMALKSAHMAGLDVGGSYGLEAVGKWFDLVKSGPNNSNFSYQPSGGATPPMTSVGLLCRQYLGTKRDDPMMVDGVKYLMGHMPDEKLHNVYYWYYATQVLHNYTGYDWDTWNRTMRKLLISTQTREGCASGSWSPDSPSADAWGRQGGRHMLTALSALTLEIYYRYLPLYKSDEKDTNPLTKMRVIPERKVSPFRLRH